MKGEKIELSISDCNHLDSLLADRRFMELDKHLCLLKGQGKDVKEYEKRKESGINSSQKKTLSGRQLWHYLGEGHGYSSGK